MKLHHINIKAPRELLEREKRFFCDVLGLREGERPKFTSRGFWLYDGDDALVHLSESGRHSAGDGQGCFDHVAFSSSGLQTFVERLQNLGIDYDIARLSELDMTQVFFESPTRTRIEVNFVAERI